jgi:hypothetical protein
MTTRTPYTRHARFQVGSTGSRDRADCPRWRTLIVRPASAERHPWRGRDEMDLEQGVRSGHGTPVVSREGLLRHLRGKSPTDGRGPALQPDRTGRRSCASMGRTALASCSRRHAARPHLTAISAYESMEDPEAAEPRGWRAFIIVVSTLAVDVGPDEQTNGQLPLLSS